MALLHSITALNKIFQLIIQWCRINVTQCILRPSPDPLDSFLNLHTIRSSFMLFRVPAVQKMCPTTRYNKTLKPHRQSKQERGDAVFSTDEDRSTSQQESKSGNSGMLEADVACAVIPFLDICDSFCSSCTACRAPLATPLTCAPVSQSVSHSRTRQTHVPRK